MAEKQADGFADLPHGGALVGGPAEHPMVYRVFGAHRILGQGNHFRHMAGVRVGEKIVGFVVDALFCTVAVVWLSANGGMWRCFTNS